LVENTHLFDVDKRKKTNRNLAAKITKLRKGKKMNL